MGEAAAQDDAVEDRSLVLKLGPAFERSLQDRTTTFGGSVAVEGTLIENWLEVEIGATRLASGGRRADSIEVLFKKPFRLSPSVEFMIGLGPEVGRTFSAGTGGKSRSLQYAADLMIWQSKKIGWYVESSYGYGVGPSRGERSLAGSAGILFGW
jgi:hypothetical protein